MFIRSLVHPTVNTLERTDSPSARGSEAEMGKQAVVCGSLYLVADVASDSTFNQIWKSISLFVERCGKYGHNIYLYYDLFYSSEVREIQSRIPIEKKKIHINNILLK